MAHHPAPTVRIRKAELADLAVLDALEQRVFATDHLLSLINI